MARRETEHETNVKHDTAAWALDRVCYPLADLGLSALQSIDSFYLRLCSDKMKRDTKRAQMRAKHDN